MGIAVRMQMHRRSGMLFPLSLCLPVSLALSLSLSLLLCIPTYNLLVGLQFIKALMLSQHLPAPLRTYVPMYPSQT